MVAKAKSKNETAEAATKSATTLGDEPLIDQKEASKILKVPVPTLVRWRYERKPDGPPFTRVGKYPRYDRQQLKAWLEKNSVNLIRTGSKTSG